MCCRLHGALTIQPPGLKTEGLVEILTTPVGPREATDIWSYPDYVDLRDAESLAPLAAIGERPGRLLAAAFLGGVRLIDNVPVTPDPRLDRADAGNAQS